MSPHPAYLSRPCSPPPPYLCVHRHFALGLLATPPSGRVYIILRAKRRPRTRRSPSGSRSPGTLNSEADRAHPGPRCNPRAHRRGGGLRGDQKSLRARRELRTVLHRRRLQSPDSHGKDINLLSPARRLHLLKPIQPVPRSDAVAQICIELGQPNDSMGDWDFIGT